MAEPPIEVCAFDGGKWVTELGRGEGWGALEMTERHKNVYIGRSRGLFLLGRTQSHKNCNLWFPFKRVTLLQIENWFQNLDLFRATVSDKSVTRETKATAHIEN